MYLINDFLLTLPIILYAMLRIRWLIRGRLGKALFVAFYVALVGAFPLSQGLARRTAASGSRTFVLIGYYTLPVLLYVVLIVLLADLAIGLLRLTRLLSRDTVRSAGFRKARLAFCLLAPLAVVAYGLWNFQHIRYHEFSVEIPRRTSSAESLRIAFAADFHLGEQTEADFLDRFAAKVNALKPDIVLFGGDILEGDRRESALARFEAGFRKIESRYGVYGVLGNHDRFGGASAGFFEKAGIRILRDEVVKIDDAFYLAGRLDAGRGGARKSAAAVLAAATEDLPVILLDHRPTDLEAVSRTRTDIQLSGHTHHGQLFPINLITDREYELSWGHLRKGATDFYVTSGIQLWGPRVRTIGYSEIVVLNVVMRPGS